MRGKMREGSAAKAEASEKIDDDQAEPPSTPRWRGHPFMRALLHWSLSPMGEVERSTIARSRSASLS